MSKIRLLDEAVYKRIAAGEVVVNPAAVVKELMENSMDAGATAITVEIAQGGKELIRVTDNGSGIAGEDVPLAIMKHATSKISSVDDLGNIGTLGFRGEALSSMAAVSRLTIQTRTANSAEGFVLSVSGEQEPEISSAGLAEGTTVRVENLFYNIPARMKFLKNTARETTGVTSVVSKLIFANPKIAIKYISNGKTIYHSPGNNKLRDAVITVYGKEIAHKVTELNYASGEIEVEGLVSQPAFLYKSTNYMCFFLNGRYVQSKSLHAAAMRGFGERLLRGHYPFSVLHLRIPLGRADVNVHPNKLQVMLFDEADVLEAVEHAVRDALGEKSMSPVLELEPKEPTQQDREMKSNMYDKENATVYPDFRPAKSHYTPSCVAQTPNALMSDYAPNVYKPTVDFEKLIDSVAEYGAESEEEQGIIEDVRRLLDYRIIGQVWNTYVIVECADCLYMIDQHAAHERINFERMKKEAVDGACASQGLLVPYVATLPAEDYSMLIENEELLRATGFEFEEFGQMTLKFSALPIQVEKSSAGKLIGEMLHELRNSKNDIMVRRDAVIRASCRYSIKAGYQLSDEQIEELMKEITSLEAIPNCPHGRPIAVALKKADLQKGFKRIV